MYTSSTLVGVWGSWLAFKRLGGDHCCLLLDIPDKYILGFTMQDLVPPSAQHLKLDNPAVVQKYNTILMKIFSKEGIDKKLKQFTKNALFL